jgi:hypothetical protein
MREPVALRAIVPRRPPAGVRRAFVLRAGEQLREQDGQDEIARGVGVGAAAGRCAQGEEQKRAQVARGGGGAGRARDGFRHPRVAPGM